MDKIQDKDQSELFKRHKELEIFENSFNEINNLLIAYASGNYFKRGKISNVLHGTDTVISGINMLGEELLTSTISRDYFTSIFNSVPDMIFVLNAKGQVLDFNDAAKREMGIEELNAESDISSYMTGKKFDFNAIIKELKNKLTVTNEYLFKATDENRFPVWCIWKKIDAQHNSNNKNFLLVARDITFQKESEKMVLKTIVETQDKEQRRVAEDLHDSLGQELSALKLFINSLKQSIHKEDSANLVEQCGHLLDDAIVNLRSICFNLMPGVLDLGGLNDAIALLLEKLKAQHLVEFHFFPLKENYSFDKDIELAVYRITQEFINNSLKHAQASNIYVELFVLKNVLHLRLNDDGKGFDFDVTTIKGNGLRNMSSRVKVLSGTITIDSKIGFGTIIHIQIPL